MRKGVAAVLILFGFGLRAYAEESEASLASELRPTAPADAHARRGDFWLTMGRYSKALDAYKKALHQNPKLVQARYRLAYSAYKLGRLAQAQGELAKVLAADPRYLDAYLGLSEIHVSHKDLDKAEAVLRRGLAIAPADVRFLLRLAQVERLRAESGGPARDSHKAKAIAELEKALRIAPPQSPMWLDAERELTLTRYGNAGRVLVAAREDLAHGKAAEALKALADVLREQPDLAEAHYLRGRALASPKINQIGDALLAYKRATKMKEALLAAAELHYEQGEIEDAEDWLKKALGLDDQYQEALYQLGLVYKELGEYEKAIGAWKKAVRANPRSKVATWAATKLQVLTGNVHSLAEGEVLDPATERHIGQKFVDIVFRGWGVIHNEALQARLDGIARKIIAVSDRNAENLRYEVKLVNQRAINAMTFPGGKIAVFQGMADFIKRELGDSDDVWAFVLGHEIAHASLRHGVTAAKVLTARLSIADTGSNFSATDTLSSFLSGFSRGNEFEADQYGCLYAYRAGYKPSGALAFHEGMMAKREIPGGLEYPPHRERLERTRAYLLDLRSKTRSFKLGLKALAQREYGRAIEHFEMFLGVFPESLAARNNLGLAMHKKALLRTPVGQFKKSSDIDPSTKIPAISLRSVRGLTATQGADAPQIDKPLLREAVAELQTAVKLDPAYVPTRVNLAAAFLDLGDRDAALEHLRVALRLDPSNFQAQNNLAVLHLEANEMEKGLQILKRLAAQDAPFPDAVYNLAVASERAGEKKEASKLFVRYIGLDKESGWTEIARKRIAALH
jgi:tetratricopeptide (TPR) repeat protein